MGLAPIGHMVTVDTAEEVAVNVASAITFADGYSFEGLKSEIETAINAYLKEVRKNWANNEASVVRVSQIEYRILDINGVLDISATTLNSAAGNFELTKYQIPILGAVANG